VATLSDCALFKFAHKLWLAKCKCDRVLYEFDPDEKIVSVVDHFTEHYPKLPVVIRKKIIDAIRVIGRLRISINIFGV
jgi:hypothetical protein